MYGHSNTGLMCRAAGAQTFWKMNSTSNFWTSMAPQWDLRNRSVTWCEGHGRGGARQSSMAKGQGRATAHGERPNGAKDRDPETGTSTCLRHAGSSVQLVPHHCGKSRNTI